MARLSPVGDLLNGSQCAATPSDCSTGTWATKPPMGNQTRRNLVKPQRTLSNLCRSFHIHRLPAPANGGKIDPKVDKKAQCGVEAQCGVGKVGKGRLSPLMDLLFDRHQFVPFLGGEESIIFAFSVLNCLLEKQRNVSIISLRVRSVVIWGLGQSKFFDGFSSGSKLNNSEASEASVEASRAVLGFRDQHIQPFETACLSQTFGIPKFHHKPWNPKHHTTTCQV